MSARSVRRVVVAVSTLCVGAMIVSAALHHVGAVVTFGCLSTASIVVLLAVVAVDAGRTMTGAIVDAGTARAVEDLVAASVAEGADESTVRSLVGAAVELGRSMERAP